MLEIIQNLPGQKKTNMAVLPKMNCDDCIVVEIPSSHRHKDFDILLLFFIHERVILMILYFYNEVHFYDILCINSSFTVEF
jgi:hypothetical protein